MKAERPKVLVIAGYDQSAGAGVLSDVKTMEANGVYAYATCTALTFQHEKTITRIQWLPEEDILEQIDLCFASSGFDWVKMGVVHSPAVAGTIIRHLQKHNPGIKVVLDPVIRSTSGRTFWENQAGFEEVADQCYLLTPNWEEMEWLYPGEEVLDACKRLSLSTSCRVYLKGGHNAQYPGRDYIWSKGEVAILAPLTDPGEVYPKHGSGCVLSSCLTANLALGYELQEAAYRSKRYIETFLSSNKSLLGWHQTIQV